MERGPTVFLAMAFTGLIFVLCTEHKRIAGLKLPADAVNDAWDEIVGLSNAPVQRPGPAYLQFNIPWPCAQTPFNPPVTAGLSTGG